MANTKCVDLFGLSVLYENYSSKKTKVITFEFVLTDDLLFFNSVAHPDVTKKYGALFLKVYLYLISLIYLNISYITVY